VGVDDFAATGLARAGLPVKLLGTGHLRRRLTITAHAASESARAAIEARGGQLSLLAGEAAEQAADEEQQAGE
jgi:large subunit ribosomal protein L15